MKTLLTGLSKKSIVMLLMAICIVATVSSCKRKPDDPPINLQGDVQTLPYTQNFDKSFGTYITYNVAGDEVWTIDFETAKMSGYDGENNLANEDWLISSPVNITGIQNAKMVMTYIARYFNNLSSDITIQVSSDYVFKENPNTATWTEVHANLVGGYDWENFITTEIDLSNFVGQHVCVAVKYLSTAEKAGTIEVKSISIEEGKANVGDDAGELQSLPYTQLFTTSFGTYTTYDVSGSQSWMIDFQTAKMTGFVNYTNYANEDWLISSPVDLKTVTEAKMVVTYIARYFNDLNNDITFYASTNYTFNDAPSNATWTKINSSLVSGADWETFITTELDLNAFVGQEVTLAVKYLSTDEKAGTIEIRSISIEEGQATGGGGNVGEIQSLPYVQSFTNEFGTYTTQDVSGAQSWMIDFQTAKMTGFVDFVNYANEDWLISSPVNLSAQKVKATVSYIARYFNNLNSDVTFLVSTDYNIGDMPSTATWNELSTTLVAGSDWVTFSTLEIDLSAYSGSTIYFAVRYLSTDEKAGTIEIKSIAIEEGEPNNPGQGDVIFSETFASGQGDFSLVDVYMDQALSYVWMHAPDYQCMKASAFVGGSNREAESWLISPSIDLSGIRDASLSFDHAYKFTSSPENDLTVWVSTDYVSGMPSSATWTQVQIPNYPTGEDWSFVNSNALNLSSFTGNSNVRIAFKYMSSSTESATWEVKNVVVE